MKTATGLTLIAIGAILAFAITANFSGFNVHVAGYVIILVGLVGLFIPRKQYSSLNRRFIQRQTRRYPTGTVVETRETAVPPYVVQNTSTEAEDAGLPSVPSIPADPGVGRVMNPADPITEDDVQTVEQLRDE